MNAYRTEIRRCEKVIMLRAVVDCSGNICRAAEELGVQRNTVRRVLRASGYDSAALRKLAKAPTGSIYRKPVASVEAECSAPQRIA